MLRVRHVLEHLDRAGDIELVIGERQVLGSHHLVFEVRRLALLPAGLNRGLLEVDPYDTASLESLRPLVHEHTLSAADIQQRGGAGGSEQFVQRALEAGHHALHQRVGRAILVVGVARNDAVLRHGHAATHTSTALSDSRALWGWPSASGPVSSAPMCAGLAS